MSQLTNLKKIITIAGVVAAVTALPAQAAVNPGDQFISSFTETIGPNVGAVTNFDFIVGAYDTGSLFHVYNIPSIGSSSYDCMFGDCGGNFTAFGTSYINNLYFDASTLQLTGTFAGTLVVNAANNIGGLQNGKWRIAVKGLTWSFKDYNNSGALVATESGNFTQPILASVPEPSEYTLMAAGLGLMGFMARRKKSA